MLTVNNLIGFGAGSSGIQFVGGATNSMLGSGSVGATIPLTSGLTGGIASAASAGDLVIAAFAAASTSNLTLSITSGYTLIGTEQYSDDGHDTNLRVAYKFISGDTETTFGFTGVGNPGAVAVYVFRGVDPTTPLDVAIAETTGLNTVLANPPAITPVTPGAFIVCVGAGAANTGAENTFTSSDLTNFRTVAKRDGREAILGIGHKPDWVSGAFNAAAFGFTGGDGTNNSNASVSIALRPA